MPTFLPWTSVEVGDLDIFAPAVPCLFVYTRYVEDKPDSTVTYFWQDETTGIIHHELLFNAPVSYEAAMSWAQEHAAAGNIERIHVRHARSQEPRRSRKVRSRRVSKAGQASSKKRPRATRKAAKTAKARRRPSPRAASKR
jgi:hypothetical protein